jgi:hypothetical protein
MNWFATDGVGGQRDAGTRPGGDQMNGNAVMYAAGKILAVGGASHYELTPAKSVASIITLGAGSTASAVATGSMAFARAFASSVVLPDGKVVTIGGMPYPVPFKDTDAVLPAGAFPHALCDGDFDVLDGGVVCRRRARHSLALLDRLIAAWTCSDVDALARTGLQPTAAARWHAPACVRLPACACLRVHATPCMQPERVITDLAQHQ